ncbi:MAG: hypothetical protein Q7S39_07630 [Ignavibacteria bacterium]|nr:hypothetical protein [Ignavibacteria bacterium]
MRLFLDNDIILKLSSIGLLPEIEKIFNTTPDLIYILPNAINYISKSSSVKKNYSQKVIDDAISVIKNYKAIPDEFIDQNRFIRLSNIDNIDSGEQLLFSLTPTSTDFLILTGDKKSLTQLNNDPNIYDIKDELTQKIVCLEFLVLKLLDLSTFQDISQKIIVSNYCKDTFIRIIFRQNNLTAENAKEGLMSYYNDLKSNSGSLLLDL